MMPTTPISTLNKSTAPPSSSPRLPPSAADEMRRLKAHNEALQRQLQLKDQGLERLRQTVQERALMLSHQQAADVQQTRREAGSVIGELEAENAKLRADLAHRTSQLHSAVTRIGALKSRMDDLILQNDELLSRTDADKKRRAAARKRKQVLKEKQAGPHAHREAMASLLGTQDSMLNLIENLSFLPPEEASSSPPPARPATARAALPTRPAVPAATTRQPPPATQPPPKAAVPDLSGPGLAGGGSTVGAASLASYRAARLGMATSTNAAAAPAAEPAAEPSTSAPPPSTPHFIDPSKVSIAKRPMPQTSGAWIEEGPAEDP